MIEGIILGVIGTVIIDRLLLNEKKRENNSNYHKGYKKGYTKGFDDGYKNAVSKKYNG